MARKKVTQIPLAPAPDDPTSAPLDLDADGRKLAARRILIAAYKLRGIVLHPISLCGRVHGLTQAEGREVVAQLRAEGELPSEREMAGNWWEQCP